MNLFSVNQVNQVYVAGETSPVKTSVAGLTNLGDLFIQKTSDNKGVIYHLGKGGVTRSDIIENVMWATATPAAEKAIPVTPAAGNPIALVVLALLTLVSTVSFGRKK